MKCRNCGYENKNEALYCVRCGSPLGYSGNFEENKSKNNNNLIIIAIIGIVALLIFSLFAFYYFDKNSGENSVVISHDGSEEESIEIAHVESSNKIDKSWKSIGSFSGSGSGLESISVPSGQIMVKISAYPIKNYADNHLHVSGGGSYAGVDWDSKSAVASKSDSMSFVSSTDSLINVDYYELVSWNVEIYKYY